MEIDIDAHECWSLVVQTDRKTSPPTRLVWLSSSILSPFVLSFIFEHFTSTRETSRDPRLSFVTVTVWGSLLFWNGGHRLLETLPNPNVFHIKLSKELTPNVSIEATVVTKIKCELASTSRQPFAEWYLVETGREMSEHFYSPRNKSGCFILSTMKGDPFRVVTYAESFALGHRQGFGRWNSIFKQQSRRLFILRVRGDKRRIEKYKSGKRSSGRVE